MLKRWLQKLRSHKVRQVPESRLPKALPHGGNAAPADEEAGSLLVRALLEIHRGARDLTATLEKVKETLKRIELLMKLQRDREAAALVRARSAEDQLQEARAEINAHKAEIHRLNQAVDCLMQEREWKM